jgi:hypothetical protein
VTFANTPSMFKVSNFGVLNFHFIPVTSIRQNFLLNPNRGVQNFRGINVFLSFILSHLIPISNGHGIFE